MAVYWNYVRVRQDEDDFTLGISMSREDAKMILEGMTSDHTKDHPAEALYDALFSAAHSDKRRDNSDIAREAPSLPETSQQSEDDIADTPTSPGS